MAVSPTPKQAVGRDAQREDMPWWVLFLALLWLVVLVVLFFVWVTTPDFRKSLPHLYGHDPGIPVEVPWFGAIGGLTASLGGIFYHNRGSWLGRFNYWHAVRPAMGAITGSVACVLLVVILRGASGNAKLTTDATTFDASAFVFGYAESAFRQLIKTVTDVFLKPGASTAENAKAKANSNVGAPQGGNQGTAKAPALASAEEQAPAAEGKPPASEDHAAAPVNAKPLLEITEAQPPDPEAG
ncbi:MAG TPA: hypothetical protein VFD88_13695 [Clostridia bacterium]|nr:hypothetical protein [Clostridia bacterium]